MNQNEKQTVIGKFFRQRRVTPFTAVLLAICGVSVTAALCLYEPAAAPTNEQLFHEAVIDSVTVEDDELFPLVTITQNSDMVTWQDGKVLMMTVNRHPELYIEGTTFNLSGDVWTTSGKELSAWYQENKEGVTDWTMRLKQLIGVPPDKEYTHVTAMWVSPEDVRRPAYSTDISSSDMFTELPEDTDEEYRSWFDDNIIWSYFDSAYPWTRLGYTYDWAADCDEYGLTEFWVRPDAEVTVVYTDTIDEFIKRLEAE